MLGRDSAKLTVAKRRQQVVVEQGLVVGAGPRLDRPASHMPPRQPRCSVGGKGDLLRCLALAARNLAPPVSCPRLSVSLAGKRLACADPLAVRQAVADRVAA